MARSIKNIMVKIEETKGLINHDYDLSINNLAEILNNSECKIDILTNGFSAGYMQGMKAAKAEMKMRLQYERKQKGNH